eukprot:4880125-Prymnesium_polylepis.1
MPGPVRPQGHPTRDQCTCRAVASDRRPTPVASGCPPLPPLGRIFQKSPAMRAPRSPASRRPPWSPGRAGGEHQP